MVHSGKSTMMMMVMMMVVIVQPNNMQPNNMQPNNMQPKNMQTLIRQLKKHAIRIETIVQPNENAFVSSRLTFVALWQGLN